MGLALGSHENEKPLVLLPAHRLVFPVGPGELGTSGDSAGGSSGPWHAALRQPMAGESVPSLK